MYTIQKQVLSLNAFSLMKFILNKLTRKGSFGTTCK